MFIAKYILDKITEAKEKQLKELDLSNEVLIEIPEEVFELKQLESLDLSFCSLKKISESILRLKNLKSLYLFGNQLKNIPESITKLTNLTELNLSNNQLASIPESISNLTNLTVLYLHDNELKNIPESITKLTNLRGLSLSNNQLKNIPESITRLTNLSSLNLSNNQLKNIPESITKLTKLTGIDLSNNQLASIPESISNLTNLTVLYLHDNELKNISESITKLTNLSSLSLSNNQLASIPESISNLTNLTRLYLWDNQLTNIPESITNLINLTILNLSNNQLTSIPESITNLTNLTILNLSNNPLENPPYEIATEGIEAIRNYFRQLKEKGLDYIYEAKLLIVGEGGAGKTTLAKKIQDPAYQLQNEDSTKGIDVIQWYFPMDNGRDFRVNIWDFGGQEIYHATHQFFLTKRSLYALVADTRKEDTDFYYWLNVVELLSDNSPLLIIKNEKQDRKREINDRALRGEFTNLKETLATNLATNRGLDNILTQIKNQILALPLVGTALPKTWKKVRETLEKDPRDYISLDEYLKICEENGFTLRKDKLQLISYLHDLGVCLHFQDEEDSLLYRTVILKPEWGTDAVYKVLDDLQVFEHQGCFSREALKNIWQEEKYAAKRGELLELMKKFQLCYEIPEKKNHFIAPQLLTENQPEYDWDESSNLILRYAYPAFMPKGIVTRFIVAMHEFIDQQKYVWRSGVILVKDNTKAEVIENYGQREIKIRVVGANKKELMTIVTYEIDKINNSYQRLKYQKFIPCNCSTCEDNQSPHFYDFQILRKFLADQQEAIQCQLSYEMVNVRGLIDDVVDRQQIFAGEGIGIDEEKEFLRDVIKMQAGRPIKAEATAMANNQLKKVEVDMNVNGAQITNMVGKNEGEITNDLNTETDESGNPVNKKWTRSDKLTLIGILVAILIGLISGILNKPLEALYEKIREQFSPAQDTELLEKKESEGETNQGL